MLFNSLTFLVFFAVVYSLYWIVPTWPGKKLLLLGASYCFYAAWSPPYVLLLLLSTSIDWYLARRIGRSQSVNRRKMLLVLSIACNLAFLGYFKYGDFLQQNFSLLLAKFGVVYHAAQSGIILPVGISFYTFASLSYTIDVYRREIDAGWRFLDYALFVGFFPHLVAGPIVRASCLLPQLATPRRATADQIGWGLSMIVIGLFCKSILADTLFAPVVNRFYANPDLLSALDAWPAILSFSGQIYYDFSGYSLCAIGLASMFGFSFPDNFAYPYAARSFSDFWRRWHISLSSWLRDYVYISMGGNRQSAIRIYLALMATMLIGGLWHGASWMFVLWGAMHGLYLAGERLIRNTRPQATAAAKTRYGIAELVVFAVVTLTWIPFRATSPANAHAVVASMMRPPTFLSQFGTQQALAMAAIGGTLVWHFCLRDKTLERATAKLGPAWLGATLAVCLIGIFLFSGGEDHAFLYFQF